ncbi:MAG: 3-phosphoshikimate 1-carboxyvinyltransferase [Bacteroidales bacterium]|nr:3-phosphoshikimate 1-carboxyvinyltransferase [Bacteroidales bacterium]
MICTSIQNKTLDEILDILESGEVEMAEIRLDLCDLDGEEIEELFSESDVPLIATCRIATLADRVQGEASLLADAGKALSEQGMYLSAPRHGRNAAEELAENQLMKAIEAGAKYVDLEMEAPPMMGRKIRQACQEHGSILIRSFHDFTGTPPEATLLSLLEKGRRFGGEVVKIVTTAVDEADAARVLALYREADPGTLAAFCMGPEGRESRLEALRLGAPFTYACLTAEEATAPGQWTTAEMRQAVYKDFRFIDSSSYPVGFEDETMENGRSSSNGAENEDENPQPLQMPASKSFAQRAIIAAALAQGTSHLSGYSPCGDNEAALAAARKLGARIKTEGSTLEITGIGAFEKCLSISDIHVGESGFLTRMLIPVLSVIADGPVLVTGEKTLLKRPLAGAHDIMASFGVRLLPEGPAPAEARKNDCFIPLTVKGPLVPGRADVSGREGSQLISGLLAALPLAGSRSTVYVHDPRSIPYMFITVDVLKKFGIEIGSEMEGGEDFLQTQDWTLCTGVTFKMRGGQHYRGADFRIEGDWSGAANFLVAGAIFGDVEVEGLDTQSLQADISIMDILMDAGASMSQLEGDTPTTGSIHVTRAPLCAFETDLNNCPDLFPIVAVLAAFCPGTSRIRGVERLRHKETDRAAAIMDMLTQMGVPVQVDEDEMTIEGMGLPQRILTGNLLKGGSFTSHGDHRMVMALKVASLGADGPVEIDDTACVAKSFPEFLDMFDKL